MAAGPRTEPLALELKSPGIVRGFSFGAAKNRDSICPELFYSLGLPINPPPRAQFRSRRNESPRTRDCDEPDIQRAKQRQHSSKMGVGLSSEGIVERGSLDSRFAGYRHYILANDYLVKSPQYRLKFICRQ